MWGLAFPLLVPKQTIKISGLLGAGGLEDAFLLHIDLSFLVSDDGLPHGTWKKARVSNCVERLQDAKQEGMQSVRGEDFLCFALQQEPHGWEQQYGECLWARSLRPQVSMDPTA